MLFWHLFCPVFSVAFSSIGRNFNFVLLILRWLSWKQKCCRKFPSGLQLHPTPQLSLNYTCSDCCRFSFLMGLFAHLLCSLFLFRDNYRMQHFVTFCADDFAVLRHFLLSIKSALFQSSLHNTLFQLKKVGQLRKGRYEQKR